MSEIKSKLERVRGLLAKKNLSGLRLRGVDWFAWATAGGSSSVIMTNEVGVAEVLITRDGAWVLTSLIESPRLPEEEVPRDLEMVAFKWQEPEALEGFIREKAPGRVACDRPHGSEVALDEELLRLKLILGSDEIARYRKIGRLASEAMTEAMKTIQASWTEEEVAGCGADALWSRGLEPTLVLVAGERRGLKYRHPIAKSDIVGDRVMMVFCARGAGLYANLTRFVSFREETASEKKNFEDLLFVEAAAFSALKREVPLAGVYDAIRSAYAERGRPGEIDLHHQGGPTGYLSREAIASPHSTEKTVKQMAFAFNPSVPGAKIEDTVLLTENGLEVLTADPEWPTVAYEGMKRPKVWVRP